MQSGQSTASQTTLRGPPTHALHVVGARQGGGAACEGGRKVVQELAKVKSAIASCVFSRPAREDWVNWELSALTAAPSFLTGK